MPFPNSIDAEKTIKLHAEWTTFVLARKLIWSVLGGKCVEDIEKMHIHIPEPRNNSLKGKKKLCVYISHSKISVVIKRL